MKEFPGYLIFRMYFLKDTISFYDFYVLERNALSESHDKNQKLFSVYQSALGTLICCKN